MLTSRLQLLQKIAIFGGLSEKTVVRILEQASEVDVAQGDLFFREGDEGHSTFVLEHGWVEIHGLRRDDRTGAAGEVATIGLAATDT